MQHFFSAGNPVIRHKYTADPNALVFDGKVYLYTGHDETPPGSAEYVMQDWLCFSTADMIEWEEHPSPLCVADFSWSKGGAWASQVVARHGKFYWYAAVEHSKLPGYAIGVAVADWPWGPFKDAKGSALISGDMIDSDGTTYHIDPTVLIDDDGQAYIYWGKGQCFYARLKDDMTTLEGAIGRIELPAFSEGAWLHKRGDWYYLLYGYQFPEKVAYAMSRSASGPWEFKGILNEVAGNCETNRGSILEYKGRSYFFYHNGALPKEGGSRRRAVCIDYLYYHPDDSLQRVIMTSEGVGPAT